MDRTLNKIYKFTRAGDQHFKKYVMEQARPRIGGGGRSDPPPPLGDGHAEVATVEYLFSVCSYKRSLRWLLQQLNSTELRHCYDVGCCCC